MNITVNKRVARNVVISILINGFVPLLVYRVLLPYYSPKIALIIATIIPLIDNLYHLIKERKADVFGMFMLLGFILSIIVLFLGGNERIILLRESFVTGVLGLVFIASLLFPKPLIYYFAIRFQNNNDEIKKAEFEEKWNLSYFRSVMRVMTVVWGVTLLGEAILKIILVLHLSVSMFLAVSQFAFYGVIGITILWTILYKKHAKKRLDVLLQNKHE